MKDKFSCFLCDKSEIKLSEWPLDSLQFISESLKTCKKHLEWATERIKELDVPEPKKYILKKEINNPPNYQEPREPGEEG